jgi:hypothetical protein
MADIDSNFEKPKNLCENNTCSLHTRRLNKEIIRLYNQC